MTAEQVIGLALALLVMSVGVIGSVLPGIPSTPLVLIAAIGHRLYFGDQGPGILVLILLAMLTAVSAVLDYLASMVGAKKLGATRWGLVGAVLGGLVGLFFGLPGVLLGPFLGALLLELVGGRAFKPSAQAGVGAALGLLGGALGKLACCLIMIGLFTANVIYRSM